MPSLDDIFRYFRGAWKMMLGRKDGLNFLDISAEDFWASFYAIAVALPPLFASWVAYAANLTAGREEAGTRFLIVTRTAVVDIGAWLVPLVIIGLLAKRIGIAKRYATYVIAINWGNALLAWLFTPITLLQLFFPGRFDVATLFAFVMFGISIVLSYRLTFVALQRPHTYAAPFFACVFIGSLFLTALLQQLLGISFDPHAY
ncbi:hypothetical protein P053_01595 [Brucella abortus 01-4165]|uniref:Membrane protein, putative n=19 Tax=Brucella TaxID=234 RepID=Q2YJQ5_BRUA2|nr:MULTISPECIES: hypothetical protein [Brucella]ERM85865.1 hypothetical protein P865_11425 [Brucella abortus 82]ERT78950.1 hypothetical protein P050_03245 [Brucella abortus 90-12178]ERT98060.1 hypothetical protein P038_02493 [Brucella abortus 99-9971-135]ERU07879.1 hypothetical protein P039_01098 [Brucella abortus 07-0994-2411]EXU83362.1 hypothetical protein AX23_06285 [Brucella melitensis 548]KEY00849.1 hypothetical protein IL60_0207895 [Brucella inopinata BO1]KFH23799.1 hypothetical protei